MLLTPSWRTNLLLCPFLILTLLLVCEEMRQVWSTWPNSHYIWLLLEARIFVASLHNVLQALRVYRSFTTYFHVLWWNCFLCAIYWLHWVDWLHRWYFCGCRCNIWCPMHFIASLSYRRKWTILNLLLLCLLCNQLRRVIYGLWDFLVKYYNWLRILRWYGAWACLHT